MLRKILKTTYNTLLVSLTLFVTLQFTACSNSPEPAPTGEKLPFGVFPLNDVKWMEEDKYTDWHDITKSYIDTITYFVRQIAENKAELYKTVKRTITVWNKDLLINTVTIEPKLLANIYLEGKKKVYLGNETKKTLWYDFTLEIRNIFDNGIAIVIGGQKFSVETIDSVRVGNEYRKRYNFVQPLVSSEYNFSVIEGIGCNKNFLYVVENSAIEHRDPIHYQKLLGVYYKDELIFGIK